MVQVLQEDRQVADVETIHQKVGKMLLSQEQSHEEAALFSKNLRQFIVPTSKICVFL